MAPRLPSLAPLLMLCAVAVLCACDSAPSAEAPEGRSRRDPAADARRFFAQPMREVRPQSSSAFATAHDGRISLRKAALTEPLLLVPSIVVASNTPMLEAGQPRVVAFRREGPKVALYAFNAHVVYPGFAGDHLLETFDVVDEDDDGITLDWSFGLTSIPLRSPIVGSDVPGSIAAGVTPNEQVVPISSSVLRAMELTDESLLLHQVARVRLSQMEASELLGGSLSVPMAFEDVTVHMHVRLTPFVENPSFVSRPSALQEGIGTFEVARTRPNDGDIDLVATRWDASKELGPITFVLTEDVPDALIAPLTEGILYWNRALGKDLVAVETGGARDMLPSARRVPVRYVSWRRAQMAYGTLQPNPLTGEILYGDIFLPSSWLDHAEQQLIAREAYAQESRHMTTRSLSLAGFAPAEGCRLSLGKTLLQGLPATNMTLVRRASAQADLMRWVIAHEVGHVLGFRHNFAATGETELESATARRRVFEAYLKEPFHSGARVSSSVMDYLDPVDAFLAGAFIRQHTLAYDEAAMAWNYRGELSRANGGQGPLYCTDVEAAESVVGCAPFDSGRNPLAGHVTSAVSSRQSLPYAVADAFVAALAPRYAGEIRASEQILWGLDFDIYSASVAMQLKPLFESLLRPTDVLKVRRQNGWLKRLRPEAYQVAKREQIRTWLKEVGPLGEVIREVAFGSGPLEPGWLTQSVVARLSELRGRRAWAQVERTSDSRFVPSDENFEDMLRHAPFVCDHLEQSLLRDTVAVLTGGLPGRPQEGAAPLAAVAQLLGLTTQLPTDPELIDPTWEQGLATLGRFILLADRGEEPLTDGADASAIYAPYYRPDVRASALRIFDGRYFGKTNWLSGERAALIAALRARILKVATQEDMRASPLAALGLAPPAPYRISASVDPKLRAWAELELKILERLMSLDKPSAPNGYYASSPSP